MEDWQHRVLCKAVEYHNKMVALCDAGDSITLAEVMDMADEMERQRVNLLGLTNTPPEVMAFARDLRGRLLSTWRWLALKADNRPVKVKPVQIEGIVEPLLVVTEVEG